MKPTIFHFPLARIVPFFITGILFAYYGLEKKEITGSPITAMALALVILGFIPLFFYFKKKALDAFIMYALAFGLGTGTQLLHEPYFNAQHYLHKPFAKARTTTIVIRERLKPGIRSFRYYALVQQIDNRACTGKVSLNITRKGLHAVPKVGDVMVVTDPIALHRKPFNPGQFDYGRYLEDKHIPGGIYTRAGHFSIKKAPQRDLWYYADQVRNKIEAQLRKKGLDKDELAVVMALILGQQQDISAETVHDYQFAGAVHILSVSGLHIGFLLLFVQFLLSGLPNSRRWNRVRFGIILTLLWAFAFLSGLSPSVIRSVTMFSFVAAGRLLRKETNMYYTLLLSLFCILNAEPAFLFDVGLQLSYLSLFFIVWLQPLMSEAVSVKNKIVRYMIDALSVSFAAQIGVLPLSIYYFHQFPGLFFVTNLLLLPVMGIIMALGTTATLLAAFSIAPNILVTLLGWTIHLLNLAISKIAGLTAFVFTDIPLSKTMMLASYLVLFLTILMAKKQQAKYYLAFLGSLLAWNMCLFSEYYSRQHEEAFIVFQQPRKTILGIRKGNYLNVYANDADIGKASKPYLLANGIKSIVRLPVQNMYSFKEKQVKLIDSTGVFTKRDNPDVLLLSGSPKLNLERYLSDHKPEIVIADGSNYKSYVVLWKRTCRKRRIPFHATAEKGFYMME